MDVLQTLASFTTEHVLNDNNLFVLGATYAIIWVMEPAVRRAIERLPQAKQVAWWERQKTWKNFAAVFWCELLVWVPSVQPPLCAAPGPDCQTVFQRLAVGAMLGVALSLLHKLVFRHLKRFAGVQTKEPQEVTRRKTNAT